MPRKTPKLSTAARHDINTSDNVYEEQPLPEGIIIVSLATTVLSSSRVRSPSPEVVDYKDIKWKRSNDPADLDALPIKMSVADQAYINGLILIYPESKIRQFRYPECTWEIITWIKRYKDSNHLYDPFLTLNPASNILRMLKFCSRASALHF